MGAPARGRYVPEGERVLLSIRPSSLFVPLWPLGSLLAILLCTVGGAWVLGVLSDRLGRSDRELHASLHEWATWLAVTGWGAVFLRLLWQVVRWRFCHYILTDQRLVRVSGVLRQDIADIPLRSVQHLTLYRSFRERITGLGTIGINTSGTAFTEAYWVMLSRPREVFATIRTALDATLPPPHSPSAGPAPAGGASRPLIVGLVGGVGSGKSAVAEEFAKAGAVVFDADGEARAALTRPEVREQLVGWWGPSVLAPDGSVDRKAVARIVFADPAQRTRLESVIHPLVKKSRADLIERCAASGAGLVVVDAPLLFEAGMDKECDRVVFVDCPRALRLERLRVSRGWEESELDAREKAQLPLEEKRRRADDIVVNDADREALAARVRDLLVRIRRTVPRSRG